jgi:hypothetical protein
MYTAGYIKVNHRDQSPCFPFYDWIIVLNSLTIHIIKLLTIEITLIQSIIVVEIRFTSLAADSLQDLKSSLQICRTNIVFWVQNKSNIRSECCNKSRRQRRYSAAGTDRSHFWYRDRDPRGNEDVLKASREWHIIIGRTVLPSSQHKGSTKAAFKLYEIYHSYSETAQNMSLITFSVLWKRFSIVCPAWDISKCLCAGQFFRSLQIPPWSGDLFL